MTTKWDLRYARTNVCEHGVLDGFCARCNPPGPAELDHHGANQAVGAIQATFPHLVQHGRQSHIDMMQSIINQIADDHRSAHPVCIFCGTKPKAQPKEHGPDAEDADPLDRLFD